MDLRRMSSNLIDMISAILGNQGIVNYIAHNGNFPMSEPVSASDIAPMASNQRLFPYPFDSDFTEDIGTYVHLYYPTFKFKNNGFALNTNVVIDIVVHKDIWLLEDNGRKVIRPYEITRYLYEIFHDKSIGNLGKIHLSDGKHVMINQSYEGIRLYASFTEF